MEPKETNQMLKNMGEFADAQEHMVQWGIPFEVLFKSKFSLFFFSFFFSHYLLSFQELKNSRLVLDVGCGMGLPTKVLQSMGLSAKFIGVDVYRDYLRRVKSSGLYDDCILASAENLPFKAGSFDSAMCLQVLEHLSREDGDLVLKFLCDVAATVVLTTPVGFVENGVDSANAFQDHKSGWYPCDLRALGFRVRGYGGLGVGRLVDFKAFMVFNGFFVPLVIYFPAFAFHMFAVRKRRDKVGMQH